MYAGGAGEVEGSWSALQQQALAKYLYAEQQAHWLLMLKETNQANSWLAMWIMMWLYQTELELSQPALENIYHVKLE